MAYGLGNYIYDIDLTEDGATFTFSDPDDPANSATATVKADAVEGSPDSREAAEIAFAQVQSGLDDKRLDRIQKEEEKALKDSHDREKREAAAREEFFGSIEDVKVQPHHVEKDGTVVYTDEPPRADSSESAPEPDDKKKKK